MLYSLAQQSSSGAVGAGIFAGVGLIFLLVALVVSIFWIWMLIDCLVSDLPPTEKLVWALVIFFLHGLGALIYFFVGRKGSRSVR